MSYYVDYPKIPIGGSNPYWMCEHCHISDPQINGKISNHSKDCLYRLEMEMKGIMDDKK